MRELRRDDELAVIEARATEDLRGNIGQQVRARATLAVLDEVRLVRRLIRGLYHHIADVGSHDELQAELERYAAALGIVKAAPGDAATEQGT